MTIRSKTVWGTCVVMALSGGLRLLLALTVGSTGRRTGAADDAASAGSGADAASPPAGGSRPTEADPDLRLDPLQPDFNLAALPTTLRLPVHKMAFRRHAPLHAGARRRADFGDLVSNFFGFDSAAQIGLELRYGLLPGTQIGVYRTSEQARSSSSGSRA